MEDHEGQGADILFKGLTRPAMKWGMPTYFFYAGLIAEALSYIIFRNYWLLILLPGVLWLVGLELGKRDASFPIRIYKRVTLTRPIKNTKYWGVNTYRH